MTAMRIDAIPVQRGFTLVELLTVVSILAVLMAAVAPGLGSFVAGQRVKAASYDLTAALLMARSEALKRNGNVRIARNADTWNSGWKVVAVASDTTLNEQGALHAALDFGTPPQEIVFNAYGRVSSPLEPVKIQLGSSASPNSKRCITLSLSGHASSALGVCP